MANHCQILRDPATGGVRIIIVDDTGAQVMNYGELSLSLLDLIATYIAAPMPKFSLQPLNGVLDAANLPVTDINGTPMAFILAPATGFTPPFKISGSGPTGNVRYRSLWVAPTTTIPPVTTPPDGLGNYMTNDFVILQTGTATGTYISSVDDNVASPDTGIGWIQIASTRGPWV